MAEEEHPLLTNNLIRDRFQQQKQNILRPHTASIQFQEQDFKKQFKVIQNNHFGNQQSKAAIRSLKHSPRVSEAGQIQKATLAKINIQIPQSQEEVVMKQQKEEQQQLQFPKKWILKKNVIQQKAPSPGFTYNTSKIDIKFHSILQKSKKRGKLSSERVRENPSSLKSKSYDRNQMKGFLSQRIQKQEEILPIAVEPDRFKSVKRLSSNPEKGDERNKYKGIVQDNKKMYNLQNYNKRQSQLSPFKALQREIRQSKQSVNEMCQTDNWQMLQSDFNEVGEELRAEYDTNQSITPPQEGDGMYLQLKFVDLRSLINLLHFCINRQYYCWYPVIVKYQRRSRPQTEMQDWISQTASETQVEIKQGGSINGICVNKNRMIKITRKSELVGGVRKLTGNTIA